MRKIGISVKTLARMIEFSRKGAKGAKAQRGKGAKAQRGKGAKETFNKIELSDGSR